MVMLSISNLSLSQWAMTEERPTTKSTIVEILSPCDRCLNESICKQQRLACNVFSAWVDNRVISLMNKKPPTRKIYYRLYGKN